MTRQQSKKLKHLPTDSKLSAIQRKGGETHQQVSKGGAVLTTNQGLVLSDNQNSLKAGDRDPPCSKILSCAKRSLILIMSASRNVSFTPGDRPRTAIFSHTSP